MERVPPERVIPINTASIDQAATTFDNILADIEHCVIEEAVTGGIGTTWAASCGEETYAACDFRFFCPVSARLTMLTLPIRTTRV
jgi:hypothetical protein